jgi:hypothetical protein
MHDHSAVVGRYLRLADQSLANQRHSLRLAKKAPVRDDEHLQ